MLLRPVIRRAPCLLDRERRKVFIIAGAHGSGKSTLAAAGKSKVDFPEPANDLSRGCSVDDIIDMCAVASIQAAAK
jgi:predicted ATPase